MFWVYIIRLKFLLLPVMYQAIDIFLDMLEENNEEVKYISKNKNPSTAELVNQLFDFSYNRLRRFAIYRAK